MVCVFTIEVILAPVRALPVPDSLLQAQFETDFEVLTPEGSYLDISSSSEVPSLREQVGDQIYSTLGLEELERQVLLITSELELSGASSASLQSARRNEKNSGPLRRLRGVVEHLKGVLGVAEVLGVFKGLDSLELAAVLRPTSGGLAALATKVKLFAFTVSHDLGDLGVDRLLSEHWYHAHPWRWRSSIPRRRRSTADTNQAFFPRGMQNTLYGAYTGFLFGYQKMALSAGPVEFGRPDPGVAARELRRSVFPPQPLDDPSNFTTKWVEDRLINGIHCSSWATDGVKLYRHFQWPRGQGYGRGTKLYLPEVTLTASESTGELVLEQIDLRYEAGPVVSSHPGQPLWPRALAVAAGQNALRGEIDCHLARGHVLAEWLNVALHRAFPEREGFIYSKLCSFLEGSDVINAVGDLLILEDHGGIASVTPLNSADLGALVVSFLGAVDWRGFSPRTSGQHNDRYNKAATVIWNTIHTWVKSWPPAPQDELRAFNHEIQRAPKVKVCTRPGLKPGWSWVDGSEHTKRAPSDEMSLSPFSTDDEFKELCTFIIYMTTFFHSWVNDAQWDDSGAPRYCGFSYRMRVDERPELGFERWLDLAAPNAVDTAYQKLISHALTQMDAGYIYFDDLTPRVPSEFRDIILKLGNPFVMDDLYPQEPRFRVKHIRSRINS